MATTYNTGIRAGLNKNGIDNSRIGYKNGYVTVDGKNFLQAGAMTNGAAYTSADAFGKALKGIQTTKPTLTALPATSNIPKPVSVPSQVGKTTSTVANAQTNTAVPAYTPPASKTQETLAAISAQLAKQQQTNFKAPEAFNYAPESDPAYQAQLALAQRNVQKQQYDTNAVLRAGGQGKSSYSETVANQIGTNAMADIANNLVPTLMNQAYSRYNDTANRDLQVQQANYSVGQDALGQLSNLYGLQDKEYFQNPIAESQVTGNYLPTEAKTAIDQLIQLKKQAEVKGITKEDRTSLSKQADEIRGYLQRTGIDTSTLGANKSSSKVSASGAGIRTLQGQQVDQSAEQLALQKRQANLDAAAAVAQITGRAVTPQNDWQGLFRQAAAQGTPLTAAQQAQIWNQNFQTNRANVSDQQYQQNFGYQQERDAVADNQYQQNFEYQATRAAIGDSQWQAQFDQSVKQYGLDYALNEQIQLGQLSIADAENARAQGKYDQEMANAGTIDVNEVASKYLDPVIKFDPNTGKLLDEQAAKRSIMSVAGADNELARKLYLRYGLEPPADAPQ